MLYELRIYHAVPARMPELLARFETRTLKIWDRYNIRTVGFWTTVIGESSQVLYYMLAWESLAERERIWNAFAADPEWLATRAETEKNGPLVATVKNEILSPTVFSNLR